MHFPVSPELGGGNNITDQLYSPSWARRHAWRVPPSPMNNVAMSVLSGDHPRRLSGAEFERSADRGKVPAESRGNMDRVRAVSNGQRPAAFLDPDPDVNLAIALAHELGLLVFVEPHHPQWQPLPDFVIATDREAAERLHAAFSMPPSIERDIELGRALGYSWDDINRFIRDLHGGYPSYTRRAVIAAKLRIEDPVRRSSWDPARWRQVIPSGRRTQALL